MELKTFLTNYMTLCLNRRALCIILKWFTLWEEKAEANDPLGREKEEREESSTKEEKKGEEEVREWRMSILRE